jgi:hypothetical protein
VDLAYPDLRYFLRKFGVNIEAPDSLLPVTTELYQAVYPVTGKILRSGSQPIFVSDLPITVEQETGGEEDIFLLNTGLMNLPWVLEEEPVSDADVTALDDLFASFKLVK